MYMKKLFAILIMISVTDTVTAQSTGKYANVNGLKMYYEVYGNGFPLVLIHGGGSTISTTFGRILPLLVKTHKIIAVELQAHGHTADIDRPLSFEQDADDVAELLKQLHISKADIFGFSNGASTTLEIAIRHPEIVNKIIVASTMYKKEGSYPWFWDMMAHPTFEQMPQPLKDAYLQINPDTNALHTMYKRDVARMQSFKDIKEEDIKAIKAPALIICGDNDVVRPEHAVEMYRQMQHAKLMILPGGHGEYMGEITMVKPGHQEFPVLPIIETFLNEATKQ
jgi:pimeloyl-ACP methyl ester carboxylesterase